MSMDNDTIINPLPICKEVLRFTNPGIDLDHLRLEDVLEEDRLSDVIDALGGKQSAEAGALVTRISHAVVIEGANQLGQRLVPTVYNAAAQLVRSIICALPWFPRQYWSLAGVLTLASMLDGDNPAECGYSDFMLELTSGIHCSCNQEGAWVTEPSSLCREFDALRPAECFSASGKRGLVGGIDPALDAYGLYVKAAGPRTGQAMHLVKRILMPLCLVVPREPDMIEDLGV